MKQASEVETQAAPTTVPRKRVQFEAPDESAFANMGLDTQGTFLSNCVPDFTAGKHRILSWNTVGVVGVRTEF